MASINNIILKDYAHASDTFVSNDYALIPKQTFLFHVYFNINQSAYAIGNDKQTEIGLMVKSADLPKFTIDTKTLNSYNRWNIIQSKVKYEPIVIRMHDDSADRVRDFWYRYYSFYYRDSDYSPALYQTPYKYGVMPSQTWGYSPANNSTQPFLTSISLYSLYAGKFTEYYLINPVIEAWEHGEHSYAENGTLQNTLRIGYEAIHYRTGQTSSDTVSGFDIIHYDDRPSPWDPAGNRSDVITDLNSQLTSASSVLSGINTMTNGASNALTNKLSGIAGGAINSLTGAAISSGLSGLSSISNYLFPTANFSASATAQAAANINSASIVSAGDSSLSALSGPASYVNTAVSSNGSGIGSTVGTYNFTMNDAADNSTDSSLF
jgi:hypothetical protein